MIACFLAVQKLGAVVVNYAKTYFTAAFPEVWLYALGALFVLVTIALLPAIALQAYNEFDLRRTRQIEVQGHALNRISHGNLRERVAAHDLVDI